MLSIKVVAAQEEWVIYSEEQKIYAGTTVTSLSIDPQLFSSVRNYLIQAHNVTSGNIAAFQIGFSNGLLQIFRTAIPNVNSEGSGLTNIYEKNMEASQRFGNLSDLTLGLDNWSRSVVTPVEEKTSNYCGKNYQTNGEILDFTCVGIDFYNTILQGASPLVFKALQPTATPNPIFSLMVQPFDPADSKQDLSSSIFAGVGGTFMSGVVDFNKADGVRGNEPGNPFCLLACEQLILTVRGEGLNL